jgi:hypothetical protein
MIELESNPLTAQSEGGGAREVSGVVAAEVAPRSRTLRRAMTRTGWWTSSPACHVLVPSQLEALQRYPSTREITTKEFAWEC